MAKSISAEKSSLIWFDEAPDDSEDHKMAVEQLRAVNSSFRMIKSKKDFDEYVQSQAADACISLIVSGSLGERILPEIQSVEQIPKVYVYCMNKAKHEKWANTYGKVKGVFTTFYELYTALRPVQINTRRSIISVAPPDEPYGEIPMDDVPKETTAPTADVPATETTAEPAPEAQLDQINETYDLNGPYIISDNCFDFILRMKSHPKEKDDLVSYCEGVLQGNDFLLARIREFQVSYSETQAMLWLQEPFFTMFINQIFKTASVDLMYYCRILIRDVQKQLKQHKCTTAMQVYVSERMSDAQFENLKSLNGRIIAMKSFLLTYSVRDKALSFTASSATTNGSKRTLFSIDANPQIENVKAFAKLSSFGQTQDENTVVFTIGSLFRVTEIEDEKDGIHTIKLTLCANDETNETKQLCDQVKLRHMDNQRETNRIGFGEFLSDFGKTFGIKKAFDIGTKIILMCLEKSTGEDDASVSDRLQCYNALGDIELREDNYDMSLQWYEKALDLRNENRPENDLELVPNYRNLVHVSFRKGDFSKACGLLQKLEIIWKKSHGDDCPDLIFCYSNLAEIYEKQQNPKDALVYYYRTLAIMTKHNHSDEDKYATIYYNMGQMCTALKQYQVGLGYYNASLEIRSKIHSNVSPTIAATFHGIGLLYKSMNDVQHAQVNLEKAAEIYRQLHTPEDPIVMKIEQSIQDLSGPNRD